jgi:hypothetical protein
VSVAACLLVAYVLSFGPACGLSARGRISQNFVRSVYAPIIFLTDRSEVADKVINQWYVARFVPTRRIPMQEAAD